MRIRKPDRDKNEVKTALVKEFNLDAKTVDLLFSEKNVTLKKEVSLEAARSLEKRLSDCGAVCRIEPEQEAGPPAMGNPNLPMTRRFLYRTRYFTDSGIIGTKQYVQTLYQQIKSKFSVNREKIPLPIAGLAGIYSLKRLTE